MITRSSGILLHIVSLPGKSGIGSLGKEAFEFVDFLQRSGQKLWQICPLSPTGYGNSPYSSYSAFAGNPLLIDLEEFKNDSLNNKEFDAEFVDYDNVTELKYKVLRQAFETFSETAEYNGFTKEQKFWLDDFCLFMALKMHFNQLEWIRWETPVKLRCKEALVHYKKLLNQEIRFQKFLQFIFFQQWHKLRSYANFNGVQIIGDMPIYVAADSVDTWSNPKLFQFDEEMNPTFVAGVPPDGFSPTGQLWGNPVYDWDYCEKTNFDWWKLRFTSTFKLYDILRIDHFIGFENYWAVPYGEKTAELGSWQKAKGRQLLQKLKEELPDLPIIAEDLGLLTDDVKELRDDFGFPGMKVLQFAFYDGMEGDFLPHNFSENYVVYTGTHDNEVTSSWYDNLQDDTRKFVNEYMKFDGNDISLELLKLAWESIADIAIAPIQDFLNLDNSARFNSPGTVEGNWQWRVKKEQLTDQLAERIKTLTLQSNR